MAKTIILLAAFQEEYPGIRQEITAWLIENPGESPLRDFLFELLEESQPK